MKKIINQQTIIFQLCLIVKGCEVFMAKAGMRRPDPSEPHGTESNHITNYRKNDVRNVPTEIQGKAKSGNKKASPIE